MSRALALIGMIGVMVLSGVGSAAAASCATADVRAQIDAACQCGSFRNHGQYMKCVRNQISAIRKSGCNIPMNGQPLRCAASSTCGQSRNPVICCKRNGRAKITSAAKCTAKGGTVVTTATSVCDANCPAPPAP